MSEMIEKIIKEIEHFAPVAAAEHVGRITAVGDGVVSIEGLDRAIMSEVISFDQTEGKKLADSLDGGNVLYGLILNLEEDVVKAVVLGDTARLREGMLVKSTGRVLSIPVGDKIVGRVVDPLGDPIDGLGIVVGTEYRPIEREAYSVIERKSVGTPLQTGIKAIDSMIPIGRGQRELIIGDRFTGKTTIAIDTIIAQKHEP